MTAQMKRADVGGEIPAPAQRNEGIAILSAPARQRKGAR